MIEHTHTCAQTHTHINLFCLKIRWRNCDLGWLISCLKPNKLLSQKHFQDWLFLLSFLMTIFSLYSHMAEGSRELSGSLFFLKNFYIVLGCQWLKDNVVTVSGEWMVSLSFKDVKETIRSADLTEARRQLKDYPWDIYCSITMSKKTVSSFFHVQRKHTWIYTLWILKHKKETSRD